MYEQHCFLALEALSYIEKSLDGVHHIVEVKSARSDVAKLEYHRIEHQAIAYYAGGWVTVTYDMFCS